MPYMPNPAGDFLPPVFKTKLQLKVQGAFFDRAAVQKMLKDSNRIALSKCGLDIREAIKQSIGQRAPKVTNKWMRKATGRDSKGRFSKNATFAYKGGLYRNATPNAAKPRPPGKPIKSWNPKRWTYRGLRFFYKDSTGTAIVGPDRTPWLNRLHEFGGTTKQTAYAIGVDQARLAYKKQSRGEPVGTLANGAPRTGVILWSARKIRKGGLWKAIGQRTARYPARPFVGSELVGRRITKLKEKFKNTLRAASYSGIRAA